MIAARMSTAVAALAALSTVSLQAAAPAFPLFRVHTHYEIHAHGSQFTDEDFYTSTRGRIVGHETHAGSLGGPRSQLRDGSANKNQLLALVSAIQPSLPPAESIACQTDPGLLTEGTYELTLYRFGLPQTSTITIQVVSGSTPEPACALEVLNVARAIANFLHQAVGANMFPVAR